MLVDLIVKDVARFDEYERGECRRLLDGRDEGDESSSQDKSKQP